MGIENSPRYRRAVHQEEDGPRQFPRLGRTEPFAEYREGDVAFFCPVFGAPDFGVGRSLRWRGDTGEQARANAQPSRLENRTTWQNTLGFVINAS